MDKEAVKPLLFDMAESLRMRPFKELLQIAGESEYRLVRTPSGTEYEVAIHISRNAEFEQDYGKDRLLEVELYAYAPPRRGRFWRRAALCGVRLLRKRWARSDPLGAAFSVALGVVGISAYETHDLKSCT